MGTAGSSLLQRPTPAPPTWPTTEVTLHRMAPNSSLQRWAPWVRSWEGLLTTRGATPAWRERTWRDDDLAALLRQTVPKHADRILSMRTSVERNDMARYAALYRDGGVYADLDIELRNPQLFAKLTTSRDAVTLPFEKGRFVGQSLMISPRPRHPFWLHLIDWLVQEYDPRCYEPYNTGPDALTRFWNEACAQYAANKSVLIADGLLNGPLTVHHATGSWRKGDGVKLQIKSMRVCPQKRSGVVLDRARCGEPFRFSKASVSVGRDGIFRP